MSLVLTATDLIVIHGNIASSVKPIMLKIAWLEIRDVFSEPRVGKVVLTSSAMLEASAKSPANTNLHALMLLRASEDPRFDDWAFWRHWDDNFAMLAVHEDAIFDSVEHRVKASEEDFAAAARSMGGFAGS